MPLLAISSPKGGVGKTTLSAHLSATFAARGHRVIAIDLDPQNALRLHLGLSLRDEAGFFSEPWRPWREAMRDTPSGVRVLPHGTLDPRRALRLATLLLDEPERLTAPVREMLAEPGTLVVVDCPPGASPGLSALMPLTDLLAVVLLADAGSAALLPQVASGRVLGHGTLSARLAAKLTVVLNQVSLDSALSKAVLDGAVRTLGPRLIGAVARDEALGDALAHRRLLLEGAQGGAAEDIQMLADAIAARMALRPPGEANSTFGALDDWGLA